MSDFLNSDGPSMMRAWAEWDRRRAEARRQMLLDALKSGELANLHRAKMALTAPLETPADD